MKRAVLAADWLTLYKDTAHTCGDIVSPKGFARIANNIVNFSIDNDGDLVLLKEDYPELAIDWPYSSSAISHQCFIPKVCFHIR